ncbi:hypothetical protein [Fibrella aquatica]|jgi:hypothetical protein|uniref:hypothetical protein n=1 Tax=Fibrella aquatica TaxID=3242487 RepID=UPI0035228567
MNRKNFLKNATILTGGFAVLGCEKSLISDLIPNDNGESLTVDEAQNWFQNTYLRGPAGARLAGEKGGHKRIAEWGKANKYKEPGKQEFVWAPVSYENENRPALLAWNESTSYKEKLAKYFVQPLVEGIVVLKEKGVTNAFLVQIAYDAVSLRMKGKIAREDFRDG